MARTKEDFLQMSGRAKRKQNMKAYCLLFTDKKPPHMEKCCDLYRKQNFSCQRMLLAGNFEGEMKPRSNSENISCCNICD